MFQLNTKTKKPTNQFVNRGEAALLFFFPLPFFQKLPLGVTTEGHPFQAVYLLENIEKSGWSCAGWHVYILFGHTVHIQFGVLSFYILVLGND